ncbi:hypothetical protein SAMN05216302_105315 [Nitrosomonas aestuarii]|uniref:Uncharacterized protein n=2 Tax=Nitrosomonas aestuarii TaxID=52441 RepID=A0A1I4GEI2_9PROT|nr:hypothetical protein SAMN05216302_105315 [Nitrosomonas aestuarii]
MAFYVFVTFLILTAVFVYFSVDRILSKTDTPKDETPPEFLSTNENTEITQENIQTVSVSLVNDPIPQQQQIIEQQTIQQSSYLQSFQKSMTGTGLPRALTLNKWGVSAIVNQQNV